MRTGRFEQIERSDGVDVEVDARIARCPVVRRLRRSMDHGGKFASEAGIQFVDPRSIANVDVDVRVGAAERSFEAFAIPPSRSLVAEEDTAHVVVDSDDVCPTRGEVLDRLGPDQAGCSRDEYRAHWILNLRTKRTSSNSELRRSSGRARPFILRSLARGVASEGLRVSSRIPR